MAYTVTVTKDSPRAVGIGRGTAILTGYVTFTTYSQTQTEITAISGLFSSLKRVICDGIVSEDGQLWKAVWDGTNKYFKLYNIVLEDSYYDIEEAAEGTSLTGTFSFIAIGAKRGVHG